MSSFQNASLGLNFNPILFYAHLYLKLCHTKYLIFLLQLAIEQSLQECMLEEVCYYDHTNMGGSMQCTVLHLTGVNWMDIPVHLQLDGESMQCTVLHLTGVDWMDIRVHLQLDGESVV